MTLIVRFPDNPRGGAARRIRDLRLCRIESSAQKLVVEPEVTMNANPSDEIVVDAVDTAEHEDARSHTRRVPQPMLAKPATQKQRKERKERLDAAVADMTFKAKGNETRNRRSRTI